jgi:sec-independent protein translocase protein TatA
MSCLPLFAFIDGLGGSELLLIMFVILILFGGEKLPHLAKGLGKSMREFKKASSDIQEEIKKAIDAVPDRPAPPKPVSLPPKAATETPPPTPGEPPAAQSTEEFPPDGPKP